MDKNFVVTALRNGFTDTQIAESLGVTPSAVSQAIDAYGLREMAKQNSKFESIDSGLNDLEDTLVKKLKESVRFAVLNPMQLASILRTVNGAKRRSGGEGGPTIGINTQLVHLTLPQRREVHVVKSARNEVIEVEGRVLQTIPSGKMATLELAGTTKEETTNGAQETNTGKIGAPDSRQRGGENNANLSKQQISELI